MDRYLCIHGHFYQPPRENPWLEAIELQDSAYPYHDWNERVSAECYAPNARSRLLDADGRIESIVNNYSRISFNFGPTVLTWMEAHAPDLYRALLEADTESARRYSGHGSAMAQAHGHIILPLANRRDKETQIIWGLRDFRRRFGRDPEGMWLPEAAVDLESLDVMAAHGIRFTVLSPYQAAQVRAPGSRSWRDARGGRVDPSMPYRVRTASGRSIAVFFYDGPISRDIAFQDLLSRGEDFAHRLLGGFDDARARPQLAHVATDGETYGHHKRHGDMGLAYALHYIESRGLAKLTNYGEFLERHRPDWEARVLESTSWSCSHGVERWRSDCGCNAGHPGWNQRWRAPLRAALDWLRDEMAPLFEEHGGGLLANPWAARNDYIDVVLDRSPVTVAAFLDRHASRSLTDAEKVRTLQLLEMQRHAMLMYTSCGWFFDELSGMETVQVIQYAARAVQLARDVCGVNLEDGFLGLLEAAPSNIPEHRNGRVIYEKFVQPAMVDLPKVAAHFAVSAIFENGSTRSRVFCYDVDREDHRTLWEGRSKLGMGHVRVTSGITGESEHLTYGILHLGDHNLMGGVRRFAGDEAYEATKAEIVTAFQQSDLPELVRVMDKSFGRGAYTLRLLFRDEQRRVAKILLEEAMGETEALYRNVYRSHSAMIRMLADLGIPLPRRFQVAADFTLNSELRAALSADPPDPQRVDDLLEEVRRTGIGLDTVTLEFTLRRHIERAARRWIERPTELPSLESFAAVVDVAGRMPFPVDLWLAQNLCFEVLESSYPQMEALANLSDDTARAWIERFGELATGLRVRVPEAVPAPVR
jgi:alpha-amylase/alpha-mannosidase (GH57 family)